VELSQQELTKRLSQEWRNLDQEGKKVFIHFVISSLGLMVAQIMTP
jgi:hypothetical protein